MLFTSLTKTNNYPAAASFGWLLAGAMFQAIERYVLEFWLRFIVIIIVMFQAIESYVPQALLSLLLLLL